MHIRFENYRATQLGRQLEDLIDRDNRYIEYAALSRAGVPAIDAIVCDLRSEFPDLPNDRTTHTFCGAMVAEVMRRHGHEVVGRGRVPSGVFKSGAIYTPLPEPLTSNLTQESTAERTMDEQIIARRITLDEYLEHCAGKTEYLNGKIMVDGMELFVGVKEFAESTGALDEEKVSDNR